MNADKRRIAVRALIEYGYHEKRRTTHGTLWVSPDGQTVLVERPTHTEDPRNWRNFTAQLRRQGVYLRGVRGER